MKILYKTSALVHLLLTFFIEFLLANLSVAHTVLFVKSTELKPTIKSLHTDDMTLTEVVILAQMITLTPGTISVEIQETTNSLLIHILDGAQASQIISRIEEKMKKPLLKVLR